LKSPDASELEKSIGYSFKNKKLLIEALTHRSFRHEYPREAAADNERLEFLGDSVLGLSVADYLHCSEGEPLPESMMSKIKSFAVKKPVLSEIAKALSLGEFLRVGKGEEETGGRHKASILADALEAVIGAVYLDGGFDEAEDLVHRLFKDRLDEAMRSGEFHDYKTELQEESQMRFGVLPEYRILREEGQEHMKIFTVEVLIGGRSLGTGTGRSKKEAQARAAKEALGGL
jgi:ribonuclease-3